MTSPSTATGDAPPFESATTAEAGAIVGCWLLDREGRLAGDGRPVLHRVSRTSEGIRHEARHVPPGARHDDAVVDGAKPVIAGGGFQGLVRAHNAMAAWPQGIMTSPGHVGLQGFARFLESLDPRAVEAMHSPVDYPEGTFDGLDPSLVPGAPLMRSWGRHPDFTLCLARAWASDRTPFVMGDAAVDATLAGHLTAREDVHPGRIGAILAFADHLSTLTAGAECQAVADVCGQGGRNREDAILTMGRILSSLPSNWTPAHGDGWTALMDCLPAIEVCGAFVSTSDQSAFLNAKGDWVGLRDRLATANGGRPPRGREIVEDAADVAEAFKVQVLTPALAIASAAGGMPRHGSNLYPPAWALLWGGRSARRLVEVSTAWHRAEPGMREALVPHGPVPRWEPGIPDATMAGVSIRVITDVDGLAAEGRRGRHCVGGYGDACASGRSRIAGLHGIGPDGVETWLSTLELRFREGRPVIGQHRGHGNSAPGSLARAVAGLYVSALSSGDLRMDMAALRPVPGWTTPWGVGDDVHAFDAAMDLWRRFLPSTLRACTADDWAGLCRSPDMARRRHLWRPTPWGLPCPTPRTTPGDPPPPRGGALRPTAP